MTREEVIKGLNSCIDALCGTCPYYKVRECKDALMTDAIALLTGQESAGGCTKKRCPMNARTISKYCDIKACPWRTEKSDDER